MYLDKLHTKRNNNNLGINPGASNPGNIKWLQTRHIRIRSFDKITYELQNAFSIMPSVLMSKCQIISRNTVVKCMHFCRIQTEIYDRENEIISSNKIHICYLHLGRNQQASKINVVLGNNTLFIQKIYVISCISNQFTIHWFLSLEIQDFVRQMARQKAWLLKKIPLQKERGSNAIQPDIFVYEYIQ